MNLRFCVWPALKLREKAISFEERGHRIWENFPIGPYNRNRLLCDCHYLVSHGTGVAVHALEPLNVSPSVLREQWRNATLATISSFYRCFFLLLDKWEGESVYLLGLLEGYGMNEVRKSFPSWQAFFQVESCNNPAEPVCPSETRPLISFCYFPGNPFQIWVGIWGEC